MQHAVYTNVVHVTTIAKSQFVRFVLDAPRSDSTYLGKYGRYAFGNHVDSVENFYVTGATTQVRTKMARHVFTLKVGALLVNLCLCANHYSRNTESTLQASACGKCI